MKCSVVLIALCFSVNSLFAQVNGTLANANKQDLASATISLENKRDSTIVRTITASRDGSFNFNNVTDGEYVLNVSLVGYQTWKSEPFLISIDSRTKEFGIITLSEDNKSLGEVVVRSEKPVYQYRPEGTIINVESSMLSKGGSALEVLERTPGILIDTRNNSIALNGKSGVNVLLNGKQLRMSLQQLLNLLASLSAGDIEKIELLTNTSAAYDAEGTAGIVNIVLKKNKRKGTNASMSLTAGYAQGEKGTSSLSFGRNQQSTNVFGSYTFSHEKNPGDFTGTGTETVPVLGGDLWFDFSNKGYVRRNNHNATIGIEQIINPKTSIGGNFSYTNAQSKSEIYNRAIFNALPDSIMSFKGRIDGTNRSVNNINSLYAEHTLKNGGKINVDADYLFYKTNSPTQIESSFTDKHGKEIGKNGNSQFSQVQRGFSATTIKVGVFKTDYAKELSKKIKFESGIKATYTTSNSGSGIESFVDGSWIGRGGTVNTINMTERIAAGYATINMELSPTAKLTAGLRYEHAKLAIENGKNDSNYVLRNGGNIFPSLFFTKKINENSTWLLSYSKRINRPTYNDLTSFIAYNDPLSVFTGNPFLKSAITHNVRLGYNYKSYSGALIYSRDNNPILQGQLTPSPAKNLVYISPQNATYQDNISLQMIIPIKVNENWNMSYNLTGGWRNYRIDYLPQPYSKSYLGYSLSFSQTYKFKANFSAELSGWYNGLQFNGPSRTKGFGALNAGLKKEFKNNGGALQLTATDFLSTFSVRTYIGEEVNDAFNSKVFVRWNAETARFPLIRLTYTRTFGTAKAAAMKTNVSDENDRIRK